MNDEDRKELLKEVRHILKVPEGASLVRYARKRMETQSKKTVCRKCLERGMIPVEKAKDKKWIELKCSDCSKSLAFQKFFELRE